MTREANDLCIEAGKERTEGGPPLGPATFQELLIYMGYALGAISIRGVSEELVTSMRADHLNPRYVAMLRDRLSDALQAAGIETEPVEGGEVTAS